jgi:cell fate (sporulation/competence/biofilm development) regulator YlbF (YheA/YmcA/DUF963 family)
MKKNIMQKVKEEQKVFHSFKELQEEWQRQGIVKPDDERINNFRIVSNDKILMKYVVVTKKQ